MEYESLYQSSIRESTLNPWLIYGDDLDTKLVSTLNEMQIY